MALLRHKDSILSGHLVPLLWEILRVDSEVVPSISTDLARKVIELENKQSPVAILAALILSEQKERGAEFFDELKATELRKDFDWFVELWKIVETSDSEFVLERLVAEQLSIGLHKKAADIVAAKFVAKYSFFFRDCSRTQACDFAAKEYPTREAKWLYLMARAGIGGELSYPWLEMPVRVCRQMNLGKPGFQKSLFQYEDQIGFEASYERLNNLFDEDFRQLQSPHLRDAEQKLIRRVRKLPRNPLRAQKILELGIVHRMQIWGLRPQRKIGRALYRVDSFMEDPLARELFELYIRNLSVRRRAVDFVLRHRDKFDWEKSYWTNRDRLDDYLTVCRCEHFSDDITFRFSGVDVDFADRLAIERIKGFISRRRKLGIGRRVAFIVRELSEEGYIDACEIADRPIKTGQFVQSTIQKLFAISNTDRGCGEDIDAQKLIARMNRIENNALASAIFFGGLSLLPMNFYRLRYSLRFLISSTAVASLFEFYKKLLSSENQRSLRESVSSVVLFGPNTKSVAEADSYFWAYHFFASIFPELIFQSDPPASSSIKKFVNLLKGRIWREPRGFISLRAFFRGLIGAGITGFFVFDVCETAEVVVLDRYLNQKYADWEPLLPVNRKNEEHFVE